MKKILLIIAFIMVSFSTYSQTLPIVSAGKIQRLENFTSQYVTARNIDIWLPEGYSENKKYAVLYMHDGQMLYDSTTTWNKKAWEVDEVVSKLLSENKIKDVIVVGIWNGGATRHFDYFPQKPFESLTEEGKKYTNTELQNSGRITETFIPVSDNYLKFLVKELKPYIDKNFSVYKNKENTFIAGSSMGGLISMYAICEYPQIFGGAACLSTHWPGVFSVEGNPIPAAFANYMRENLPNPKNHKIYFDYGDQTIDALYPPLQKAVDAVMLEKGFTEKNWKTLFFEGKEHSEEAWRERLHIPLIFLLGK